MGLNVYLATIDVQWRERERERYDDDDVSDLLQLIVVITTCR